MAPRSPRFARLARRLLRSFHSLKTFRKWSYSDSIRFDWFGSIRSPSIRFALIRFYVFCHWLCTRGRASCRSAPDMLFSSLSCVSVCVRGCLARLASLGSLGAHFEVANLLKLSESGRISIRVNSIDLIRFNLIRFDLIRSDSLIDFGFDTIRFAFDSI